MVYQSTRAAPGSYGEPSGPDTAAGALRAGLARVYPAAPADKFRAVQQHRGQTKYEYCGTDGQLQASFPVGSEYGVHFVEPTALCESPAKRWSR